MWVGIRAVLVVAACLLVWTEPCRCFFPGGVHARMLRSTDKNSGPVQTVRNCTELQEALRQVTVIKVVVEGHIECTRQTWRNPILVRRNVEVAGSKPERGDGSFDGERLVSIDWTDVSKVVVAERGAVVFFHDLLMYQEEMGIGGLNLAFITTRKGATGVFAGVVVIVGSCPQPVNSYNLIAKDLPRPEFLAGEQTTVPIDKQSLLVRDVAIWWPNINSLWQICNTVFVCGLTDRDSGLMDKVGGFYNKGLVEPTCETLEAGAGLVQTTALETPEVDDQPRTQKESDVAGTIIVVVVALGVVLVVTAGITYYCIFARNGGSTSFKYDEKGDSKFDNSQPRVSAAYDLFEKNINVPLQDVEVGTLLGRGGFGKVYKGTWKGTTVAIKVIEHGERLMENELKLPFEAYLSKHISHPNVVQTFMIHTRQQDSPHGVTVDTMDMNDSMNRANHPPGQTSMLSTHDIFSNMAQGSAAHETGELFETWLVLEFCDRGSLAKAVKKGLLNSTSVAKPQMDHVLLSALDVANAMNYLHSLGITHGDLKADNVLLKSASTDRRGFFCKVSDFGLSRWMRQEEDYIQTFTYGTITHMPPELLKDGILTPSVDVYSFGMLLWELLSNEAPYPAKNHGEIILTVVNEGRRPHVGAEFPEPYADLIKDCWKQNRHDRPKFTDIVTRLKDMLASMEATASGGSPSKSALRSVNDSAGSVKKWPPLKRNLSHKKKQHGQNVVATMPDVRSSLYYDSSTSRNGEAHDDAVDMVVVSQGSARSTGSDPLDHIESLESRGSADRYTSAQSHITRSSDFTSVNEGLAPSTPNLQTFNITHPG